MKKANKSTPKSKNQNVSKKKDNIIKYEINNNDELREHFHGIHNLIRNQLSLYGKSAKAVFDFIYGLKLIEPMIKNGKIHLSDKCLYSEIAKEKNDKIIEKVRNASYEIFDANNSIKKTFFTVLPFENFKTRNDVMGDLFRRIDAIDADKFDIAGKIFEYFLGYTTKGKKAGSQMDDLGQYFTDRSIVRYIMMKINPKLIDKENVPSMTDTFCGSCGFPVEYIRYLNKQNPKIDWDKQLKNIYACDTDQSIVKSSRIDIMSLTHVLPYNEDVEGNDSEHIVEWKNSFTNKFDKKFDYYFTNPPYGGDKGKNENDKVQLENAGKEIKHVAETGCIREEYKETCKYKITGNNKETLSLLLGMGLLNEGGTYVGVLKEGVFFDKKFMELRKQLIENYTVEYVISVPSDVFENTSVKTSILIFKNVKPDIKKHKIRFCEIELKKDNNNHPIGVFEINPLTKKYIHEYDLVSYENKKDKGTYIEATYKDVVEQKYSLNYKNYMKEDIKVNKGFKIVKLGDILEYLPKSKRKAGDENEKGIYRFYTSSDKIKKCDFLDISKQLCIIFGTGGKGSLFLDTDFSCSADNFICKTESNEMTTYIYYYLKHNWEIFINKLFNGTTLGHLTKDGLNKYEIPIPEDIETIKLYLNYLNPCNESLQSLQSLQSQKEKSICGLIELLTKMGENGVDYDEYKLGDICEVKAGKYLKTYESGIYPIIGGGNISGNINIYSHENDWIIHKDGVSNKIISYITGKFFINHHGWSYVIKKNIDTTKDYISYYIMSITNKLIEKNNGSAQKGLNQDTFYNTIIRILKPEIIKKYNLDKDFEFMDKLRNNIQNLLKNQEKITKQMMKLVFDKCKDNEEVIVDSKKLEEKSKNISKNNNQNKKTIKKVLKDEIEDSEILKYECIDSDSESDISKNKEKIIDKKKNTVNKVKNKSIDIEEENENDDESKENTIKKEKKIRVNSKQK